jgi:sensor histidine kinase regulating citrate/malate metabolism
MKPSPNGSTAVLPASAGRTPAPAARSASFRLLRYFSVASLLVLAVVAASLTLFYGWKAEQALLQQGEQKNAAQLRLILNHLVDAERAVLGELLAQQTAPAADSAAVRRLNQIVARSVAGTTIIKLKLFNVGGLTVYSTEAKQIGENKADYPGFVAAKAGAAASQLSQRESFESLGGTLRQVDVIGSYLPVRDAAGAVIGVVEIYDNVTLLAGAIRDTRWQVMVLSIVVLLVLYIALLLIVRHADSILQHKARALEAEVDKRVRLADELQRSLKAADQAQRATERANAMAHAARRDAEAASAAKSEFLHAMVERLRTPINGAIGLLDVLRASQLSPAQRAQVDSVREQALSLLALLSDNLKQADVAPPRQ